MKTIAAVSRWAHGCGAVIEDVACKGTPLEAITFKVGSKAFLFVQSKADGVVVRLKLAHSIADAQRAGFKVGKTGWAKLELKHDDTPALVQRLIAESHALLGGTANDKPAKKPAQKLANKPPNKKAIKKPARKPSR